MPGSQEYGGYDTMAKTAGAASGSYTTPLSLRGLLQTICTQLGLVGGITQGVQVGNGTTGGATIRSGSGAASAQTFTSVVGDIWLRTDGGAANGVNICTVAGTPGTYVAIT